MDERYDLIVIGGGAAGLAAAGFAGQVGARVALLERDRVGGDCTWTGCVPSKALLKTAAVAHQMRHADRYGLTATAPQVDVQRIIARVNACIRQVYQLETPEVLRRKGVDVMAEGPARFLDRHRVEMNGRVLRGKRFVICTGARAAAPLVPGLASTPYLTYETVFGLERLPSSLAVLGAGPVGLELAQAFGRLGVEVTIVEIAQRVLPSADPDASAALAHALAGEGIGLLLGREVQAVEKRGGRVALRLAGQEVVADTLLVATGRRPEVEALHLHAAGVAHGPNGIVVDGRLRTSQPHIYAAGDATGSYQFTHYAAWQGFAAARNALLPGSSRGIPGIVPWVVFTDPEVAQIGLDEAQANLLGERVRVYRWPMEHVDRAVTEAEPMGFVKLVARPNGTLLGATVVAAAAGEMINHLALAIRSKMALSDLAATIHAYPTFSFGTCQLAATTTLQQLTSGWRRPLLSAFARWPL